jgi:hypothetical protein
MIAMKTLLGLWMIDPESNPGEIVTMEFKENGQLIYTLIGEEKDYVSLLTYRIENDILITDQPSAPREAKGKFSITPEGKLVIVYDNLPYQYVRAPDFNSDIIN